MKNQKGITLVALIITIIVMVILAGVIIASAVADGGIIDRAQSAMEEKEKAEAEELIIASYVYKTTASASSTAALLDLPATADALYENLTTNEFKLMVGNTQAGSGSDLLNGNVINLNIVGKHGTYEGTVTEKGLQGGLISEEKGGNASDLEGVESENAKYFNFTVNEGSKTAVLTGIKEEYYTNSYYNEQPYKYPTAINDNGKFITSIKIPEEISIDGIVYKVTEIGDMAFATQDFEYGAIADAWFTDITIPYSVTKIGMGAFANCQGLKSITIPEGITTIGDYAFAYSGLETLTLPENITNIGKCVVELCDSLSSVYCKSKNVFDWGYDTWCDEELNNSGGDNHPTIYLPQESFDYQNFKSRAKQEYFTYTVNDANKTATITGISESYVEKSFYNNRNHIICIKDGGSTITDIIIPSEIIYNGEKYTVISIGEGVFKNSDSRSGNGSKFTSVFIPKTITSIASDAFYGCKTMYNVYCEKNSLSGLGEQWLAYCGFRAFATGFVPNDVKDNVNLYLLGQ